jgi:hypothetical protein
VAATKKVHALTFDEVQEYGRVVENGRMIPHFEFI